MRRDGDGGQSQRRQEPPEPPAVLFLIHDLGLGGAERVFLTYVRDLEGVRPVPVLLRPRIEILDGVEPDTIRVLAPGGLVGRARTPLLPAPVALVRYALRLLRAGRDSGARTISTFLHKSHAIGLCAKLIDRKLRVVLNIHEIPSQHLNHHFGPFRRPLMRWIIRRWYPRADLIVVVAQGVKDDLVDGFGVPASRIRVVPNPLDLSEIRRRAKESVEDVIPDEQGKASGPLVVAVGRLVSLKGFHDLLNAWARLPAELGARLALIGDGEERLRLEALAEALGVEKSVQFLGSLENPWKVMARAQVFVLPSHTEGFPNVIGEALALGLPVVATRCSPGVSEYLEEGRSGVLVPPGDPAALAVALEEILLDPERRRRLAERGQKRVEAFDLPRVLGTYEAVLKGGMPPPPDGEAGSGVS